MNRWSVVCLAFACSNHPTPVSTPSTEVGATQPASPQENLDQGQQHPPIPPDDPSREWDAGGFVSDYGWYGEHSWADVRMRLAGHLSVIGRDRARLYAIQGDYRSASNVYSELADTLDALQVPTTGASAELVGILRQAAHRDAALLNWLATDANESPPLGVEAGLDGIRQATLALEREWKQRGPSEVLAQKAQAIQEQLAPHLRERPDLAIDAFEDFNSRHTLRVQLFDARMDSLDPLGFGDPWGYWHPTEIQRQAHILGMVLADLGGTEWHSKATAVLGEVDEFDAEPYLAASAWGQATASAADEARFTVKGLGWLCTGDSLIDVAAQPGPMAIGTLMKLGIDDPQHRPWLEQAAMQLNATLDTNPQEIPALLGRLGDELNEYTHGSRYYNVKQLRNEGVRVLARNQHFDLAREVLLSHYPLKNHDWAVPNRAGILEAIEGRLLALGNQTAEAQKTLQQAWTTSMQFLAWVDQAEAAGPGKGPGKTPPRIGPPPGGGPQGPPPPGGAPHGPPPTSPK